MTELHDDRVERMRAAVLDTVQADVRHRGRRTRRVLTSVVAGCFVLAVGSLGVAVVDRDLGAGGGAESSSADVAAEPAPGPEVAPDEGGLAYSGADQDRADGAFGLDSSSASGGAAESLPDAPTLLTTRLDPDRDVVTTGTVTVRVDDARATADTLAAWVEGAGGRTDQRTETDSGRDSSATLVVRVPAARVDGAITELRTYGDVTDVDVSREDVTAARADLDARIRSLTISVDRLRDIAADADTAGALLRIEEVLSSRQADLESLQSQREALGDRVALSTLTVDLVPAERAGTVEPGGFSGGLTTGWNALVGTVNGVVHAVGVLAPWLAVGAVGALAWWGVRRRGRGRGATG